MPKYTIGVHAADEHMLQAHTSYDGNNVGICSVLLRRNRLEPLGKLANVVIKEPFCINQLYTEVISTSRINDANEGMQYLHFALQAVPCASRRHTR